MRNISSGPLFPNSRSTALMTIPGASLSENDAEPQELEKLSFVPRSALDAAYVRDRVFNMPSAM